MSSAKRRSGASASLLGPWQGWMDLWTAQAEMNMAAAEVIARRSLLAATGALTASEAARMVLEKPAAFASGFEAMAQAILVGASPETALRKAAAPVSTRARANARRLRR